MLVLSSDNKEVAIKSISKLKIRTKADKDEVDREIAIMRHLVGHPNIVSIIEVYEDKSYIHLVMQLCKGGELFDQIINKGHYSEKEAAELVRTMLCVIKHMHTLGVVHRDLKPENFLFTNECDHSSDVDQNTSRMMCIDFGLSCFLSPSETLQDCVGSSYYIAPEVLKRKYGREADIWSAGVILYILLCGSPPFFGSSDREILQRVMRYKNGSLNFKFPPWPSISDGAKECVQMMLRRDPRERPPIDEILNHPWMKENGTASDVPIGNEVINRLQNFVQMGKLQRMVSRMMAEMLSPAEMQGLNAIFEEMDEDKDGTITVGELRNGLHRRGLEHDELELEVKRLMDSLDMDGSGTIDLKEFMSGTMSLCQLETEENMMKAFAQIDTDGNGYITKEELARSLERFGLLEENAIEEIIEEVDSNKDGLIEYSEFVANLSSGKVNMMTSFTWRDSRWGSRSSTDSLRAVSRKISSALNVFNSMNDVGELSEDMDTDT